MAENTLEEEILENSDNTEGFSPEDYLETPSLGTIEAEYAEAPAKTNSYHNNTPILNQGNVGACSVFGITKAENEEDFYDTRRILDAMKIRDDWVAEWRIPNWWKTWWSMAWALRLMKDLGYITWWFFCSDKDAIGNALANKRLCYTWTNRCNWRETKKTWIFTPSTVGTGHLFAIVWIDWDNEWLIAANSWGEDWGQHEGLFFIPFKYMNYLYSTVAIIDKADKVSDEIAQDMKDAQHMKELGIWNGQNPDENLEKLHAVYMVMRAFWEEWISDEDAVKAASEEWIATNLKAKLTRRHFLYMVFRAAYGITKYEYLIPEIFVWMKIIHNDQHLDEPITRYHASLIIARMLRNLWQID